MYQKILIIGNLGGDPEMRYTPSGQAVTNFTVATNRQYTASDGEKVKETLWLRVSAWGRLAETCNTYLKRGSRVLVEGRLTADPATGAPRIWTKKDGTPGASFEISDDVVRFLSGCEEKQSAGYYPDGQPVEDEDIPF